jgi:hypothetical protein
MQYEIRIKRERSSKPFAVKDSLGRTEIGRVGNPISVLFRIELHTNRFTGLKKCKCSFIQWLWCRYVSNIPVTKFIQEQA